MHDNDIIEELIRIRETLEFQELLLIEQHLDEYPEATQRLMRERSNAIHRSFAEVSRVELETQ